VLVRVGQRVTPVQVIARRTVERSYRVIDISRQLDIPRAEVAAALLVEEGMDVQEDEPLVRVPGRFGRAREYRSPVTGVLHRIINGRLVLCHAPRTRDLRALMPGYVTSIVFNRGAVIETFGSLLQGLWGSGASAAGRLELGVTRPDARLSPAALTLDARNKILIAGIIDDAAILDLGAETGVRGFVAGSMPSDLCRKAAAMGMPVLLTDGIGRQPMGDLFYELLSQSVGRDTALLGTMGGERDQRAELIIPMPADRDMSEPAGAHTPAAVGTRVRLLRQPHLGRSGQILALHFDSQLPGGAGPQPGADVRLSDGRSIFVPLPNLEILE
jgi:hypothetical protein